MKQLYTFLGLISTIYWLPFVPPTSFLVFKDIFFILVFFYTISISNFHHHIERKLLIWIILLIFLFLRDIMISPFGSVSRYVPFLLAIAVISTIDLEKFKLLRDGLIKGLLIGSVINSTYVFVSVIQGYSVAPQAIVGNWANYHYAPYGFTNSHTLLSPLLAISALITLYIRKWYLFSFLGVALFFTGGEGGILSLLIVILLKYAIKFVKYWAILLVIIGVIFIQVYPLLWDYILTRPDLLSTINEHVYSANLGFKIFNENTFFGVGVLRFREFSFLYSQGVYGILGMKVFAKVLEPHNFLAFVLASGGILAGFLVMSVYIGLFYRLIKDKFVVASSGVIAVYLLIALIEPWVFVSNIYMNLFLIICVRDEKVSSVL